MASIKKYRFKATIQPGIGGGAGILFPYDVEQEFGTRARVPVKSTLDGLPYSGSLIKCGAAEHMLGVLKAIREQIGKGPEKSSRSWFGRMKTKGPLTCPPNSSG